MSAPLISVIICTYNRAHLLPRSLESICKQTIDRSSYEIIVVDNNSKDRTREVVESFQFRYPGIRYSFEIKQGLSNARNNGWKAAAGRYVGYIDDDSEAPPGWLALAKEIIIRFEPAVFGGPVWGIPGPTRPRWFKDAYLLHDHSSIPEACFLPAERYGMIAGGNMFLRCDLLSKVGEFDPRLGMCGDTIAYGEESLFMTLVARHTEEKVYFDPMLYNFDLKRPEKMECRYALRASFGAGRSSWRRRTKLQLGDGPFKLLIGMGSTIAAMVWNFVRAVVHRDRKQYPFIQNHIYECSTLYARELGRCYEQFCTLVRKRQAEHPGAESSADALDRRGEWTNKNAF